MPEMWDIVDQNGNKTGRLHERGRPMQKGEYPLSVSVWILNRQGEFLISKRAPAKTAPGMWETTGGGRHRRRRRVGSSREGDPGRIGDRAAV